MEEIAEGLLDKSRGIDYVVLCVRSPLKEVDLREVYKGNIVNHSGLHEIVSRYSSREDIREALRSL